MKALILAGGLGTRLRPLTCTRPKHLFPVANKPILDWTIENLAKSQTQEIILAVNYMANTIAQHYKKTKQKPKITLQKDNPPNNKRKTFKHPLGTGGAIKNVQKLIGHKEAFFVLNGDILTNLNYTKLMKSHKLNKKAAATIALHRVKDPTRYGVAELNKNQQILRFVEKPQHETAPSNMINAGIYVLEPEIFNYIPKGKTVSIEREVFPKLAEEGKLYGYNFKGLWIDIGEPQDYLKANRLWLNHEIKKNQIGEHVHLEEETTIKKPSTIGNGTSIDKKSEIGPHVTLGKNVTIGKDVRIKNSIVFPEALISDFTSIIGAIIGEAVTIGSSVKIENSCLIGDHATIRDKVTLTEGVAVCPWKEVADSVVTNKCLM